MVCLSYALCCLAGKCSFLLLNVWFYYPLQIQFGSTNLTNIFVRIWLLIFPRKKNVLNFLFPKKLHRDKVAFSWAICIVTFVNMFVWKCWSDSITFFPKNKSTDIIHRFINFHFDFMVKAYVCFQTILINFHFKKNLFSAVCWKNDNYYVIFAILACNL